MECTCTTGGLHVNGTCLVCYRPARDCSHANTTEPFEMDGFADGAYRVRGLFWVCCRDCGRTVRTTDAAQVTTAT